MIINVFALLFLAIMIPCMGWLSDQIGRRKVFMSGLMGMIILVYPIFLLLMHRTFASVLSAELLFALLTAPIAALIPTMLVELFPIHVRNTGSSLGYNCSLAVFGGTTPLVAMLLQKWVGSSFAPAYYVMLTSIISLTAAWFFWKVKPSVVLSNTL
jgi:MFS family permease